MKRSGVVELESCYVLPGALFKRLCAYIATGDCDVKDAALGHEPIYYVMTDEEILGAASAPRRGGGASSCHMLPTNGFLKIGGGSEIAESQSYTTSW